MSTYKVPTMAEMASNGQTPEVLFWVGCAGSFDERYKAVTQAFVKILNKSRKLSGLSSTTKIFRGFKSKT